MNTVSSSSTYSATTSAASSNGLSGLMSGMDTEAMVEKLLSGTQSKIDEQEALKQQTTWKQEIYREIISQLNTFQNTFFGSSSSTNLLSASFYNAMTAISKSDAFSVVASSSAATGTTKIQVTQLATSKVMTGETASGTLQGKIDLSVLEGKDGTEPITIDVYLNGVTKTLSLEGLKKGNSDAETYKAVQEALQKELNDAFGLKSTEDGIDSEGWVTVGLDSVEGTLTFNVNGEGNTLRIGGSSEGLNLLGLTSGASNKVNLNVELKDLNLGRQLSGTNFTFEINGESFSFSENATINEVMKAVNNSSAGVRMTYSDLDDTFKLEALSTGKGQQIETSDVEGNLLTSLFGGTTTESSNGVTRSDSLYLSSIQGGTTYGGDEFKGGTFSLTIDGKAVNLEIEEGTYTRDELMAKVNQALQDKGYSDVQLEKRGDTYTLKTGGKSVSFASVSSPDDEAAQSNLALAFGFNGVNNTATSTTKFSDLGIDPTQFGLDADATMTQENLDKIKDYINAKPENQDVKIVNITLENGELVVKTTGEGKLTFPPDLAALFKTSDGSGAVTVSPNPNDNVWGQDDSHIVEGQNAKVTINGVELERSSNTITANGLTITLKGTTNGEEETIETSRGTDQIVEGLKSFVEQYNSMIDKLRGYTDADATYKDYAPLTEAQKKEMTDREIELWEEKAKEGLLRNDSDITSFLSSMRSILYTKPEGADFALYQFGIETSSEWSDKGKLVIDEAKLRSMLESNPEAIQDLFLGEDGLATKMNETLKATANTSSGNPGTLVQLAGVKNTASAGSNTLSKRLDDIAEKLQDLKDQYESEKNRYWRMFNSMETAMSNLNSQSAWLSSQFG